MFLHKQHDFILPFLDVETTEKHRLYKTPDGKQYPSVTTVLGHAKQKDLEEWRNRVGEEEANRISHRAATRGTMIHEALEKYLNNDETYLKGVSITEVANFKAIANLMDQRFTELWFQEVPLYSDYLRTAGRCDLIGIFDGKLSIVDFKTSVHEKKREYITSYFMQEAFYAFAFHELTSTPINQLVTIIVSDDLFHPQVFKESMIDHIKPFMKIRQQYMMDTGM